MRLVNCEERSSIHVKNFIINITSKQNFSSEVDAFQTTSTPLQFNRFLSNKLYAEAKDWSSSVLYKTLVSSAGNSRKHAIHIAQV